MAQWPKVQEAYAKNCTITVFDILAAFMGQRNPSCPTAQFTLTGYMLAKHFNCLSEGSRRTRVMTLLQWLLENKQVKLEEEGTSRPQASNKKASRKGQTMALNAEFYRLAPGELHTPEVYLSLD